MKAFTILFALICAALLAAPASATLLVYHITGTLTLVEEHGQDVTDAEVGDPFTASFVYDTDAMAILGEPGAATYDYTTSMDLFGLMFSSGDLSLNTTQSTYSVIVSNDRSIPASDGFSLQGNGDVNTVAGNVGFAQASFFLRDSSASVFSTLALPSTLDLADFDTAGFFISDGDSILIRANIETLEPWIMTPVVPEPTTMTLVGLGLAGVALRRRKRS